ncbi:uncharacterized protein A4U43_C01F870 [Asparagus officinalis]|uniref:Uncharacterized protein n=1 Tax=Asparagus officinalis TaxID=4686 RepID=A0A5P1FKQ2_ASPOF|nr:uncharacterized protein A4U43_C01F870 [Asparagus officinalis]
MAPGQRLSGIQKQNAKDVDRKNFLYIEYLIRRGKKQLEQLKSADTVGLSTIKITTPATPAAAPEGRTAQPASPDSAK